MLSDVRRALRILGREPALAASVVLTLGLGVGIATAIFSTLNAVVLQPLPYGDPARLVVAWQQDRTDGSQWVVSPANFLDWQQERRVFAALGAVQQFQDVDFNLTTGSSTEHVRGIRFTPDVLDVLGVRPHLGRTFTQADADARRAVALLSYDLWLSRFARDPAIVGREIVVNGAATSVIGVMPRGFEIPLVRAQLFLPLASPWRRCCSPSSDCTASPPAPSRSARGRSPCASRSAARRDRSSC
jgi:putative ABC transport system permease protein